MKTSLLLTMIATATVATASNANAYGPYLLPDSPPVVFVPAPVDEDVYGGPQQHGECGMGFIVRTNAAGQGNGR